MEMPTQRSMVEEETSTGSEVVVLPAAKGPYGRPYCRPYCG